MIILIVGSPGSGKTTISRKICEMAINPYENVFHVEVDDIRAIFVGQSINTEFNSAWLDLVLVMLNHFIQKPNHFIIIEGLFFEVSSINFLKNSFEISHFFEIESDLSHCLKRNKKRLQQQEILPDREIIELHEISRPDYLTSINNNKSLKHPINEIWEIINIQ